MAESQLQDRPSTAYRRRILDEFLSCGICLEPCSRPKALPCLHNFCQACLEDQRRRRQPFNCPLCRTSVNLPRQGVAGLPDNHLVVSLCEEFSKKTQVGGQKCCFHPRKGIDLFCQQCEVPVCSECIVDSHPGHNVTGVRQVATQIKANIRTQLNNGLQKMLAFSTFIREIDDVQKRLTDNMTQVEQAINRAFDEQVQKLQQKDRLLVTVERNLNMAALARQRDQALTQLGEMSSVCEGAEAIFDEVEEDAWLSQNLNLAQKLPKFQNVQTPEICETKLCHFEPEVPRRGTAPAIQLGKVTSEKQSVQSDLDTTTGQARSSNLDDMDSWESPFVPRICLKKERSLGKRTKPGRREDNHHVGYAWFKNKRTTSP